MENENIQTTPQPPVENKDGMATAILVLGILSLVCCAPCGIVALALRATNIQYISEEKQGMVKAGFVCSIIGIALWGVGIVLNLLGVFTFGAFGSLS